MPWSHGVSRPCTPHLQCVILSIVYLHSLFIPALLGQSIIATLLLVLNLVCAVRYENHRWRHLTLHSSDNWNDAISARLIPVRKVSLLSFLLPSQLLLYVSLVFSCLQLFLAATLGWLLGLSFMQQGWPKAVLNSLGVWGRKDVLPLVVNVVSSTLLAATSAALCFLLRKHQFQPSTEPNRLFHRSSLLCLALLAPVTASLYPTYDCTPLFVVHFLCMMSFSISSFPVLRVRLLEVATKGCTVVSLLLLAGGLLAQSPVVQKIVLEHGEPIYVWSIMRYECDWAKIFKSAAVFRRGAQFLLLAYTIVASRYVHGSWRCISRRELEEHREYFYEPPFLLWQLFSVRYPARLRKIQQFMGYYLPLAVFPLMIIMSFMVMDLVSILMVITTLFGFLLPSDTYVALLPFCYGAIALGIVLEFVATVDSRLQQPFFMVYAATGVTAFMIRLAQCFINSLLILAVCMFRVNPIQGQYRSLAEKKAQIRMAFNRLQNRIDEIQCIFKQVCNSTTGTVNRDGFPELLKLVVPTSRIREKEIDSLWRFLTEGEPVLLQTTPQVTPRINKATLEFAGHADAVRNPLSHLSSAVHGGRRASTSREESNGNRDGNDEKGEDMDLEAWEEIKNGLDSTSCMGALEIKSPSREGEKSLEAAFTTISFQDVSSGEDQFRRGEHKNGLEEKVQHQQCSGRNSDALSRTISAVGSPGGTVAYLDFLVLVSKIELYRMQHRNGVYVAASMLKQIICLNASTLSLVAMFAISMAVKRLDILNGVYLLFFIGLACVPWYMLYCWFIIVAYTALHVAVRFTVMVYNASYHPNDTPSYWMEIIGIDIGKDPFALLVYFLLLILAVFQLRISRHEASGKITIQEILQRMEWRRFTSCDFFPQFYRHFLELSTSLVLVMMALFIPHNVFIAGFALLFLLYFSLGAYSKLAESVTLIALGAYNVAVLLISALYHVPAISNSFAERLSNVTVCQKITVQRCALDVGVSQNNQFGSMSLNLLPWYLAAALSVALCRHYFGVLGRGINRREEGNDDEGASVRMEEMQNMPDPSISSRRGAREEEEEEEVAMVVEVAREGNHAMREERDFLENDGRQRMGLFFRSYTATRGTFIGRCVPMAFAISRYLYLVVTFIREAGTAQGKLMVWVSLAYASLSNFSLLGAAFMALFLLDSRGMPVVAVAVAQMALNYVYPFFFIPEAPFSVSSKRFFGLQKTQNGERPSILPPILACAMAVFYMHTEKDRAARHQEDALRQAHRLKNPPYHTPSTRDGMRAFFRSEEIQTPYVPFVASRENRERTREVYEPPARLITLKQQLIFMWNYFRTRFFLDLNFELTVLVASLGLALTPDRVTGLVFFVEFLLMWLIGRVRSTTEIRYAVLQESLIVIALGGLYFIRLGLPKGLVGVSILHPEECNAWDHYCGCGLPLHHFVLMFALVVLRRCMRQNVAEVRATILCVEGAFELGELLRRKEKEVEDCRRLLRSDIESVLPAPSRDIIRNPRTLFDLLIAVSCACLPAAVFAFVQGVLMASLLGVVEIAASLWILAFKRYLAWRWHKVWPFFILFLFLTFVPQLLAHLPLSPPLMTHAENVMLALGFSPWSRGTTVGQAMVLFSAVLQQRIFSEFFFAAYLIGLCRGSLAAVERNREMLEYFRRKDEELQCQVVKEEEALKRRLEQLFSERNMCACQDEIEIGALMPTQRVNEKETREEREFSSGVAPLSPMMGSVLKVPLSVSAQSDTYFSVLDSPKQLTKAGAAVDCPATTFDGRLSGVCSEEHVPPAREDDRKGGICSKISNAIECWSEQLVQYFSFRTYRGKAPPRTYSQGYRVLFAFTQFLLRKYAYVCYFLFMLNYALSGTIVDMVLSLSAALYGMLILPWSGRIYWRNALIYNVFSILVKCVIQLIVKWFAMNHMALKIVSACVLDIGLDRTEPSFSAMNLDIIMDFVLFVSIIIHRQFCFDYGVFANEHEEPFRPHRMETEKGEVHRKKKHHRNEESTAGRRELPEEDMDRIDVQCVVVVANEGRPSRQAPLSASSSSSTLELLANKHDDNNVNNSNHDGTGEYNNSIRQKWQKRVFRKGGVLHKYWSNICERYGTGSDYYTLQFWADGLSLIVFTVVYFLLAGDFRGSILYSVQQDLLPWQLVLILFAGVMLMAAERIVYVLHSVQLKFVLHVVTILAYHAIFMLWRLTLAHRSTTAAVIILLMRFFSGSVSALQLQKGYPFHRKHDPFTTHTDIFHWLGHVVYRAIPFLFELRLLLDWSVSCTALKLQHWMLLEDVHHTVYMRYVDINDLAWTSPRKGRQFPFFVRMYQGIVGFAACLLVLFFPLMLYSTFNPNVGVNLVSSWQTKIAFGTTSNFYTATATEATVSQNLVSILWELLPSLQHDEFGSQGLLQLLMFPRCSAEVWSATPETRLLLLGQLNAAVNNETTFFINKEDHVVRMEVSAPATRRVRSYQRYMVPWSTVVKLRDALEGAHLWYTSRHLEKHQGGVHSASTLVYESGDWIPLPQFYSPFLNNIQNDLVMKKHVRADCAVQLNGVGNSDGKTPPVLYWCVRCNSFANLTDGSTTRTWSMNGANEPLDMADNDNDNGEAMQSKETLVSDTNAGNITGIFEIVASSYVALNLSLVFLPNMGIIALYTTFILAIGTFLRNTVMDRAHRVVLMQVANPDPIAELLRYIYMARSSAINGYVDGLLLEQQLFFELVDMLRSPERVLALSGRRVDDYDSCGRFCKYLKKSSYHPF
ncbi:hypothetical protein ECC02_007103 [Trypanosoma cruzi]|uniref:Piezo non-specific cation channel R-Ras-binding domain-containing protein n=1 Tax=Trypanosoma cruzi TaxID=5693 RepID=A0A7J6Y0E6_TRYCR|nr:hypothetical protein ECC02_007103 [Trypanosoma cruzi]